MSDQTADQLTAIAGEIVALRMRVEGIADKDSRLALGVAIAGLSQARMAVSAAILDAQRPATFLAATAGGRPRS